MPIRITDYINVSSPTDTYATHLASLGRGGFRSVMSIAERNAITSARTETGMWVNVVGDGIYEWNGSAWDKVDFSAVVLTDATLTGDGFNTLLGVPLSTGLNNQLILGPDGRLYVPSGEYFTGIGTAFPITGDGYNNDVGLLISSDSNNLIRLGSDSGIYALSGNFFTGVKTDDTINGDGLNTDLTIPISIEAKNILRLGSDGRLYVPQESGNLLAVYDEGSLKTNNASSVNFVGDGVVTTNIGDNITVTIPGASGAQTDIRYYYGNSSLTFAASTADFFQEPDFLEDDPYGISDGTGTLTIPRNGRYRIEFHGSIDEVDNPTIIQINVNNTGVAFTKADDSDTGTDVPFALFYEYNFASGDIITFGFDNGNLVQAMVGLNEIITSSVFGGTISGSDLAVYNEGVLLNNAVTSINFVGVSIEATNQGQAITVSGVDQSYTGSSTNATIDGNGFNIPLSVNISSDTNNIIITGSDGGIFADVQFTGVKTDPTITGDGYLTPLGIPVSVDSGNSLTYGSDSLLFAPGMDKFTNLTPMPEDVGGLEAGTNFNDISITGLLNELLYPYQYPSFAAFTFNQTSPVEVGSSISGTKNFTWGTTNTENVLSSSIEITDVTSSTTLGSNLDNDDSENLNIGTITRTSPISYIYRISAQNTKNQTFSRNKTIDWYYRVYWGNSSNETLNSAGILSLTGTALVSTPNRDYTHGPNDYKYICYPSGFGLRTSFLDGKQQLEVSMEPAYVVNVTNSFGLTIPYYVHRTTNTLGDSFTIKVS